MKGEKLLQMRWSAMDKSVIRPWLLIIPPPTSPATPRSQWIGVPMLLYINSASTLMVEPHAHARTFKLEADFVGISEQHLGS